MVTIATLGDRMYVVVRVMLAIVGITSPHYIVSKASSNKTKFITAPDYSLLVLLHHKH